MFVSIEIPRQFLKTCIAFGKKAEADIDKIGRIELLDSIEGWKRARLYTYYSQGLNIFENRVKFVLDTIDRKMERLDVTDQILRGMLELYCRFLFIVRSEEIDKFRRIIWQDLVTYCNLYVAPQIAKQFSSLMQVNYKILENLGEDVSSLNIEAIKEELSISYSKMTETKKLRKLRERMGFPSIRKILVKYYDETEEPIIARKDLYRLYSRLSEQIHGNIYYEIPDAPAETAIFRILASVILLQVKFHREIALITRSDKEYGILLGQFREIRADFSYLWDLTKKAI
ncbi:MAG: hypothetical protein AB1715_03850 [Acidobacteriota bacterium]